MIIVILVIAVRSYRNFTGGDSFSYDSRVAGPFWRVGLGANHSGAFMAYCFAILLGVILVYKEKKLRMLSLATLLFSLHPIFFSYSRGAYLAVLVSLIFIGLIKKRSLIVLVLLVIIFYQAVLPKSVVDRINGTQTQTGELDGSAGGRLLLWEQAIEIFEQNPVFGVGYGGFGLSIPKDKRIVVGGYGLTDTHNLFVKILCEQGVIGFLLLVAVLFSSFMSGLKLYLNKNSLFNSGLGIGFAACTIALLVANCFGDRFSYPVVGTYFWVFLGLVDRGIIITGTKEGKIITNENSKK
jgi:O-antigen ligase